MSGELQTAIAERDKLLERSRAGEKVAQSDMARAQSRVAGAHDLDEQHLKRWADTGRRARR